MRFFYLLCAVALVAALAVPFYLKGPNGLPLMTVDKLMEDNVPRPPTEVYRWQDDEGVWHFSDEAPHAGVEQIEVRPNLSPIKADWVSQLEARQPPPEPEPQPAANQQNAPSLLDAYSADAMDEAKQAAELMEQHTEKLQKIMQDLKR